MIMVVTSFTLRISGVAALETGSSVSFLENWDSRVQGELVGSNISFRTNYPSKKSEIESLVPYTIEGGQIVPSSDPTDSPIAVTSVSMVISGQVAYDDNSSGSFEFEVRDDGSVFNHTGVDGEDAWIALAEDPTASTIIEQMFTDLYSTDEDPITVAIVTESESSTSNSMSSESESTASSASSDSSN